MHTILLPVVALVAWTFVMWSWMYATRIPAIRASRMVLDGEAPRGQQMATLPAHVRWKADNYNHLHEQPQVFYAIAIVAYLIDRGDGVNLGLAWAYVGLRVVHSLWQALVNVILVRFTLFVASSLVLLALTIRVAYALSAHA
jgi:hypothetical protein